MPLRDLENIFGKLYASSQDMKASQPSAPNFQKLPSWLDIQSTDAGIYSRASAAPTHSKTRQPSKACGSPIPSTTRSPKSRRFAPHRSKRNDAKVPIEDQSH